MPTFEHFLRGHFNGTGYFPSESPRLNSTLDPEDLQHLMTLGIAEGKEAVIETWLPKSKVDAVTYLKGIRDEAGRRAVWNHSIIVPQKTIFDVVKPSKLFAPFLIRSLDTPPTLPFNALEIDLRQRLAGMLNEELR